MFNKYKDKLFSKPLNDLINSKIKDLIAEILNQPDEYFEEVPVDEFTEYLNSKYLMYCFPKIIWEEIVVDFGETEILGSDLPREFFVHDKSKKFTRKVVYYYVPTEGDTNLLYYQKSNLYTSHMTYGAKSIEEGKLKFEFIDVYNDPNKIEAAFEKLKEAVNVKLKDLQQEFDVYNTSLIGFINTKISERIAKIKSTNDYKSKFKYPIKKKNVATAFESPRIVKKKKISPKPSGAIKGKTNQLSISDEDYNYILELLQDCGRNWEQHPDIYKGKGEEALRDQLIFVLAPNIDGVVAGEAYNKKGKTDIAIKHQSINLFIGECKIWKGPKVLLATIDQILSYLTWRDSKAAVMMFIPNKEISTVSASARETIEKHSNYVRTLDEINEGWVNYRFHIENDPGTFLTLAIQLYHLPEL